MRGKIIIDGIAHYHPEKKVTNDFFFQHFNKQENRMLFCL